MINGEKISSVKQLKKLIKELPAGKSVAVLVQRGRGPIFLALKTP